MRVIQNIVLAMGFLWAPSILWSQQDTARYIGNTLVNVDYHHGQLQPVIGVHNIQTFRAQRSHPVNNWTYNHAPMLTYWNHQFYLEYLSNPVGEHVAPGQSYLQISKDGYDWSEPLVIFPKYKIADGFVKEGRKDSTKNTYAVMHQRIGFYTASSHRLFALGYYGIVMGPGDDPNDGKGIGRVIREIKSDGSFGPIYFLRYNHRFTEENTNYPFYKSAKDKGLIAACDEILASPLLMQQMVEEADRDDALIPLKKDFKAFNFYHLPDGRTIGWWKYALTSISQNDGKSWQYNPTRAPGFVNSNAKIWGQRIADGNYITVYNPSEFRWPLALSLSKDGLQYDHLLLVNGEISSMRYGGAYKSYGPQYVRGIQEMDTQPKDAAWVTYSMNKEDIWVSKIPTPIYYTQKEPVEDIFDSMPSKLLPIHWNVFSPLWCPVSMTNTAEHQVLRLQDHDPFDYAKVERVLPAAAKINISFAVTPLQQDHGQLDIEITDKKGNAGIRLTLDSAGQLFTKVGYRNKNIMKYATGQILQFSIRLNTHTRFYELSVNGKPPINLLCYAPIDEAARIVFRTGGVRRFPDADTPTDQMYDLPDTEKIVRNAIYDIHYLKASDDIIKK